MISKTFLLSFIAIAIILVNLQQAEGHGMMLNPVSRSSRWRYDSSAPANYDDNGLYCGGMSVQWHQHGGKCGICGDNYADPTPRANELGGKYGGSGVIVQRYNGAYTANIEFKLTTNHLGYAQFDVCNLDAFGSESEACFSQNRLRFADGSDRYYVGSATGNIGVTVVLPQGLRCNHCVLRWTYTAGNNWGTCEDGSYGSGCGPQETFKNCADVSI